MKHAIISCVVRRVAAHHRAIEKANMLKDFTQRPRVFYMKFDEFEVERLRAYFMTELTLPIAVNDWHMTSLLSKKVLELLVKGEVDLLHVRSKMPEGAVKVNLKKLIK